MAETITLSGVPETMLQTVYARAKESRGRGAIRDLKAEEIIGRLDYDFSLADKDAAMHSGVIARTIVLDRLVGEYLAAHPGATAAITPVVVISLSKQRQRVLALETRAPLLYACLGEYVPIAVTRPMMRPCGKRRPINGNMCWCRT